MAGYGLMMGLGQGLQQVGGMLMDDYKTKLANKMDQEKEARAEARRQAEEQRKIDLANNTPDLKASQFFQNDSGQWMEQLRSSTGVKLGTPTPASQDRILDFRKAESDIELGELAKRLNIQQSTLSIEKQARDLENYDADRARDIQYDEARIDATRRSNQPRSDSESSATMDDYANQLKAESPEVKVLFGQKSGDAEPLVTPAELDMIALDVVKAAAARGLAPNNKMYRNAVEEFIKKTKKTNTVTTPRKSAL